MTKEEKISYNKEYYETHRGEILAYQKEYRKTHCSEIASYMKKRYKNNRKKIMESAKRWAKKNPKKIAASRKKYRINNHEAIATYHRELYQTDINHRLASLQRSRLNKALKGSHKSGSAVRDLGCTVQEFVVHLEKQFQPGMIWKNQGKWHIDHIIPLSSFDLTDREQLLEACHYTNLQPLWAIDNIKKGNKTIHV